MALHRRILTPTHINGSDSSSPLPSSLAAAASASPSPHSRHISNLFIAAGCLVAASFFLALTYYAVFNRRWRRRRRPIAFAHSGSDNDDFIDADGDHDHDRHLWQIHTVGLDEVAISSIAVYEYTAKGNVISTTDCSVCLAEFADGELVRLLPKCAHAFHVGCIDTWLRAHVSCPLCRAPIVTPSESETVFHSAEEDFGTADVRENSGEVGIDLSSASSEPVRRSVSLPVAEMEGSFREEEKEPVGEGSSKGKLGSTSKEMEKSLSGSGTGFFFSKNGRSRSLVLPL